MTAPERILVATYSGKTHSGYWGVDDVSFGPKIYILATPEALAASPEVAALIADAVAKERDRCEDAAIQSSIWVEDGKRTSDEWARGVRDSRRDIAAAIRDGHKPGE